MKTPKDYNGKVILKFATSPHGLLDDLVINLINDQIEEVGYVETSDIIIHLYKLDDITNKIDYCKYIYDIKYDCYTSMTYEKINSICKIIKLI
jgi:hypothetical protein